MRVIFTVFADDQAFYVDLVGFEKFEKLVFVSFVARDAIISDERIGENQDLPSIRRVSETFRIAHHSRVENDFALGLDVGAERFSLKGCSVLEDES